MLLFSSIIIAIILSYAIIRIYIYLHIYLPISETEGLAEPHRVKRVYYRKLIQYTSTEYHLRFQECFFKNLNVLDIEAS